MAVLVEWRPPEDPDLLVLITEQQAELARLEGEGHVAFPLLAGIEFVVGVLDDVPVGCGALQPLAPGVGEVKRMFIRPPYRGRGLARRILAAIERLAASDGLHTLRLETGRFLPAALGLYTSSGYQKIPLYGQYAGRPNSICFEKVIKQPVDSLSASEGASCG